MKSPPRQTTRALFFLGLVFGMKQPPRIARLVGTSWTSEVQREGWRHFHVVGLMRGERGWLAELAASCDGAKRVFVEATELLEHDGWRAGWLSLREET